MVSVEYQEAMVEVIYVLQHCDEAIIEKIPINIIKFLNQNALKDYYYNPELGKEKIDLNKLPLKSKSKAILAALYRDYLCTPEEKMEFNKELLENEKNYQKQIKEEYKDKNLFDVQKEDDNTAVEKALKPVKEKSKIRKFFEKLKNIFSP